jgi:predicted thioesterase
MPSASLSFPVTEADTAQALGSGDLPVLATPRLLAWCEAATCAVAAALDGGIGAGTSVGTRVSLEHVLSTGVGGVVTVTADLDQQDGRLLQFSVVAHDAAGRLLATGEVRRVVVDRARFLARVPTD